MEIMAYQRVGSRARLSDKIFLFAPNSHVCFTRSVAGLTGPQSNE